MKNIITEIEDYLSQYVSFSDSCYLLPLALWTIGTYLHQSFDAFPYLVITSDTKRSGKTRLAEILGFTCSLPRMFGAMTPGSLFRAIDAENPTLFFDEAEILSSEAANTMRAILNMGYRRGQTVPRVSGNSTKEYNVFCPKVFILIGDVYDTLKDRAIIVRMKRAEAPARFIYEPAKIAGAILREEIKNLCAERKAEIERTFNDWPGIYFLTDRDEEIWTPLFALASILCPERMTDLSRYAVDLCTEKTQESRKHTNLLGAEKKTEEDEYSRRLLLDTEEILKGRERISSAEAIIVLKALPTSPWRKFQGDGIDFHSMAALLSRFGVKPKFMRLTKGRAGVAGRGYLRADVEKAAQQLKT